MPNSDAVVFCRVSTARQADKWSLPKQREINRKYAKDKGFSVVQDYSITESGWKDEKPVFKEMVDLIKANGVGHLVVLNVERLCRDFKSFVILDDLIEENGLTIHFSESSEIIDKNVSSDKRTFWAIKVAMARQFILELKRKARRSIEARLEKGLYPYCAPIGYSVKTSVLTPIDEEVRFVRKAYELYASGVESEASIVEKLWTDGLRSRRGVKVTVPIVSRMLNNPLYIGYLVWPYADSDGHKKGDWLKGQHEPIIERPVWDKVQAKLKEKGHSHPQKDRFYVYRGLMRCGHCGHKITAYKVKGYTYYACSPERGTRCRQKNIREEQVAKAFADVIGRFRFPPDMRDWMKETLRATNADRKTSFKEELQRLNTEFSKNDTALDQLLDLRLKKEFGDERITRKRKEIEARQAEITRQIAQLSRENTEAVDQAFLLLDMVQNLPRAFAQATDEQKHRLLRILFDKVIIKDNKFSFKMNEPFGVLYQLEDSKSRPANSPHMNRLFPLGTSRQD